MLWDMCHSPGETSLGDTHLCDLKKKKTVELEYYMSIVLLS